MKAQKLKRFTYSWASVNTGMCMQVQVRVQLRVLLQGPQSLAHFVEVKCDFQTLLIFKLGLHQNYAFSFSPFFKFRKRNLKKNIIKRIYLQQI